MIAITENRSAVMSAVFKAEAHKLIDRLPESASWEDLVERVEINLDIEAGLAESVAKLGATNDQVRREFGLA